VTTQIIKGVTLNTTITSANELARKNIDTIIEFFSLYLKDKQKFYSLWVENEPQVITPFASAAEVTTIAVHSGWDAVKGFWDPIYDEMTGTFDWFIDEIIPGEDPSVIVTRSNSVIDVHAGPFGGTRQSNTTGATFRSSSLRTGRSSPSRSTTTRRC
jgi:hypothetical protein